MNQVMCFQRSPSWRKRVGLSGLCVLLLGLSVAASPLWADPTNAAPANPPAAATPDGGFGQYLVDHQAALAPFFSKNGDELIRQAALLFLGLLGRVILLTLIAGWAIDVILSRCFSVFFAPIYAKLKRAFIYATGQLVLNVVAVVLLGLVLGFSAGLPYFGVVILVTGGILLCGMFVLQIGWVIYLYRTHLSISAGFYLAVFVIHVVTAILVAAPIFGTRANDMVTSFVDLSVTPKLQAEVASMKHDMITVGAARDQVKAKVADAEERLTQAQAQQQEIEKAIEEKKNSEIYLFSQIMKVEAKGDLAAAHSQLTGFLAKFPTGIRSDAAKAQLAQVDGDLAAQEAQKKQAILDAARDAAQARADLLARAAKGEVTLSEMRLALIGKKPADVSALFGPAVETDSNRWGYNRRMISNPLTGQKLGLTVYFNGGLVQGVDYYYGSGDAK